MEWTKIPTSLLVERIPDKDIVAIIKYQMLWAEMEEKPSDEIALRYITKKQLVIVHQYIDSITTQVCHDIEAVKKKRNRDKKKYWKKGHNLENSPSGKAYGQDGGTVGVSPEQIRLDKIREDKKEKESKEKEKLETYEPLFLAFFDAYPRQRRGSKQKAYGAYIRAIKRENIKPEQILIATKKYASSKDVAKGYAKGCEAWLNGSCFLNEYEQSNGDSVNPVLEYMMNKYEPKELVENSVLRERYIKKHSGSADELLNACGGDAERAKEMIEYYVKNIFPKQNKDEFYLWDVLNNFCKIHEGR